MKFLFSIKFFFDFYKTNKIFLKKKQLNSSDQSKSTQMGINQSQESQKESFKFFWRSDPNPWSSPANGTWSPYDEGDNQFLNNNIRCI